VNFPVRLNKEARDYKRTGEQENDRSRLCGKVEEV
jgi:hypothetical protein